MNRILKKHLSPNAETAPLPIHLQFTLSRLSNDIKESEVIPC